MADDHPAARLSALDCDIIRGAFRRSALEEGMPEKDRRRLPCFWRVNSPSWKRSTRTFWTGLSPARRASLSRRRSRRESDPPAKVSARVFSPPNAFNLPDDLVASTGLQGFHAAGKARREQAAPATTPLAESEALPYPGASKLTLCALPRRSTDRK